MSYTSMLTKLLMVPFLLSFPLKTYASEGMITWFDIKVKNMTSARTFYSELFGWQYQGLFPGYSLITLGDQQIGGLAETDEEVSGHQGTMIYFKVQDILETYRRAIRLGAASERSPTPIPGFGFYAIIRDLDDNQIALFSSE